MALSSHACPGSPAIQSKVTAKIRSMQYRVAAWRGAHRSCGLCELVEAAHEIVQQPQLLLAQRSERQRARHFAVLYYLGNVLQHRQPFISAADMYTITRSSRVNHSISRAEANQGMQRRGHPGFQPTHLRTASLRFANAPVQQEHMKTC